MSDLTVRFPEGGRVTIEGLDGISYSHVTITEEYTTFTIKGTTLRVGWHDMRLQVDDSTVYEKSWERAR